MKIKNLIILLFTTFLSFGQLYSQCIVDAGSNRNVCFDEIQNGAKLYGEILSGDIVEFKWESIYYEPILNNYYYASIMLSDTTILEPTIDQHLERTVKYYLTGITSTNETCIDSVELNFSDWMFLTIDKITGKMPTDTIELWIAAESNWPHLKYEWSPNYMISDTSIRNPLVWNDTTVFYNLEITDSIGCSITDDVFEVYVNSTSTEEMEIGTIQVYPNPTLGRLNIQSNHQIKNLKIFDLAGNFIKSSQTKNIDLMNEKSGIYILQINMLNGSRFNRKIIKKETP